MSNGQHIKVGMEVALLLDFRNGAQDAKHRRVYPAGTKGKVVRRERDMLELAMENPSGVSYADGIIRVHKTRVVGRV